VPRKQPQPRTVLNAILSFLRLVKNGVLASLGYWFCVRPLVRRGYLVLVDRYVYNYYLDPASVKFSGSGWLLDRLQWLFPKPDVLIKLTANPGTLLARKQELTAGQIHAQSELLAKLDFGAARVVEIDAAQPVEQVARRSLEAIGVSETPP
jgi:thymidylate kinase